MRRYCVDPNGTVNWRRNFCEFGATHTKQLMSDIFISYRRDDSEGHAGRLFEGLKARFGRRRVFIDVDGIEPGRDFRRIIDEHVSSCHVLLALIGKDWLHAADKDGRRRLDAPEDFVRLEIAAALRRDIAVIPVLVQGATMPGKEELPPDLQAMVSRNGAELRHSRWDDDFARLEETLQSLGVKVVTVELLSKKGINYSKLRNLLSAGNWKKADHATYEMMVKAANRSPAEGLAVVDIRNFPTVDLHTIDQLWVGYSDGRFGFSLQKRTVRFVSMRSRPLKGLRGQNIRAIRTVWQGHWVGGTHGWMIIHNSLSTCQRQKDTCPAGA